MRQVRFRSVLACVLGLAAVSALGGAAPAVAAARGASGGPSSPELPRSEFARVLNARHGSSSIAPPRVVPCASFSPVSSPNVTAINVFNATAALYPGDIWAVGATNTGATNAPDRNLAEHWNGTSWSVVATPSIGNGFNDLTGVAALDSNNVWAVGNSQNNGIVNNLALHWNGVGWSAVSTPQPSAAVQALGGVSAVAANDIWAVGFFVNGSGVDQALALHWNGSAWSTVATADAGTGNNVLETVYARATNDAWAVGYYRALPGTGNPRLTLVEHWDGVSWTIQSSPNPVTGDNVLFSVAAVSSTDVWAVGTSTTSTPLRQTLVEHLVSGTWTAVSSPDGGAGDNELFGLVAPSSTNVWAVGYQSVDNNSGTPLFTLAEHWDGSSWTIQPTSNDQAGGDVLDSITALPGSDLWAAGAGFPVSGGATTLASQFQLPAPTSVSAAAADQFASVSWTNPSCDGGFSITSYVVTASDGCTVIGSQSAASSPYSFITLTNGSPVRFTVQASSASLGAETPSALSAPITPTGATVPVAQSACSGRQYSLASPGPTNFTDIDASNLALTVAPAADSTAVIDGNTDLWTANSGVNQDLGIFVSGGAYGAGTIVGWKESGGSAGTFSPNAAAVQTVIPLTAAGGPYTVKLQWKSNKTASGATIFAGAGPLSGDYRFSGSSGFSPTRLSVHLVPTASSPVSSAFTNSQYRLTGSNGVTFTDVDTTNLTLSVTPGTDSTAVITGNVDLWTANSGFNQDIGINVDGQIAAWKESGGSAGTFSPNAAFVQAVVPLTVTGSPHVIKLQWKTNKPEGTAAIYAGAGPWPSGGSVFSPTRLTVWLVTPAEVTPAASTLQYHLSNSDGAGWTPIDGTLLQINNLTPGITGYTFSMTANVDLWTANSGFNQDIGIFISGGVYGGGTLVAWKESGGSAGTFSPNAAFVDAVQHLQGGTYTIWLAWKTNKPGAGSNIYAAAGPWPPATTTFSPSRLTAAELSSP